MTAKPLRKVQLCPECRLDGGLHYDESTDPPTVTRCPNLRPDPSEPFDAGMEAAAQAHPSAMAAAVAIITDAARALPYLSANDTRAALKHAQVPTAVIGAAFHQLTGDGVLVEDGLVRSTDPGTHGKRIIRFRSTQCRRAAS